MEEAKKWLQMQGIKTARKKATRLAGEGLVSLAVTEDQSAAVILEINCETDFSSNTVIFRELTQSIVNKALAFKSSNLESFLASPSELGTIADELVNVTSKIGENIQLRRLEFIQAQPDEKIISYIHNSPANQVGEIAVIAIVSGERYEDATPICMQIAAMNPTYINMSEVPENVLSEYRMIEKASYEKELQDSQKKAPPANVVEKIIEGKVLKKLSEEVLMNQEYIVDNKQTVQQAYPNLKVKRFIKYRVGEGIEKVQTNLAEEVSKQVGL